MKLVVLHCAFVWNHDKINWLMAFLYVLCVIHKLHVVVPKLMFDNLHFIMYTKYLFTGKQFYWRFMMMKNMKRMRLFRFIWKNPLWSGEDQVTWGFFSWINFFSVYLKQLQGTFNLAISFWALLIYNVHLYIQWANTDSVIFFSSNF